MNRKTVMPALAFVAAGLIGSGLTFASVPATAAAPQRAPAHALAPHPALASGKTLSKTAVSAVRDRQSRMIAQHHAAPAFAKAGSKTFTVTTTEDSDLANPAGKTCVDAATGACSLRAAVNAANNKGTPVTIVLGKHTYTLSLATTLNVYNPAGTSIVGKGAGKTSIKGDGSGVFYVATASGSSPGLLYLTDLKVTGGTASYGGGLYVDSTNAGATVVLDHVTVSGNTASTYGGGLYASDYNTIYARSSTFSNNVAQEGAGLYVDYSDVNLTGTTLTGNHSPAGVTGYGGGLYNEYGVVRIKGGSISGNSTGDATSNGEGGGIYDEYGNLALNGVHVDHNTANDSGEGGGLFLYYDLVDVNGGTISHNHAQGNDSSGGGVYVDYGSQLGLHGVTMTGNRVGGTHADSYGGGALYLYAYEYGNQTTIDQGTKITGSNGGAVYGLAYYGQVDLSIEHATLSGNHNTDNNGMSGYGCGGAICAYGYEYGLTQLTMTGSKVENNSSTGNNGSGAVTVYGYEYTGATVSLRGNRFESNVAGAGGYGGAVLVYNSDDYSPMSVRSHSNTFTKNKAGTSAGPGYGGALALYYYANLSDQGSTFSKNVAVGSNAYGGAVMDESDQSNRFTGTTFTGNRAGPTNGGTGYGGGLYAEDEAGIALTRVTLAGNRAASYGGGLYAEDGYGTSVMQSTVSGNTAGTATTAGYGGGIYAYDGTLTLENSTVAGNTARSVTGTPGQGGGINAYDGGAFNLRYTTVSGNTAKQGGGVYSYSYGGNILSSIVSDNHATKGGAEQDCTYYSAIAKPHSLGGNVLGKASCVTAKRSSDRISKKPKLGNLKDNGGSTKTMALAAKSPAVGRATFQIPSSDQRGHKRPGNHADAGAFELPKVKKKHHH